MWLYGPAGAGKSAIVQTIAEKCTELNILLASFFFSRADGTRNHPNSLVATIAYQIRQRIPEIASTLDGAIERDPMIFEKTLNVQIDVLIVKPFQMLVQSGFFSFLTPHLILIDGLDECNDERHRCSVLRAIACAIREHRLPFIFLVSSRPETDIRMSFNSDMAGLWDSLPLDNNYHTGTDIQLFLNDRFKSIKTTHPMKEHIPLTWPESSVINTLVRKSSGQFIYPSTVIKYISATHASPPRQLDVILGVRSARAGDTPFAEIDALYTHILLSVQDTPLMLDILALLMGIFYFGKQNSSANISQFLCVDPVEVDLVLASLVSITRYESKDSSVHISHASLSDFLRDKKRSGNFYIDKTEYHTKLFHQAVKQWCSESVLDLYLDFHFYQTQRPLKMTQELYCDLDSLLHKYFSLKPEEVRGNLDLKWVNGLYWLTDCECVDESKVCKIISVLSLINVY